MAVFKTFSILFLLSLAMLTVSAWNYNCTPGETFKQLCNTCTCAPDGKTAACTRKACASPGEPGFSCIPNEHFKNVCNDCVCGPNGRTAVCTSRPCSYE